MPRFEPFPGIRYDLSKHDAAVVTSPPYDVIDDAQRAELAAQDPFNAVLIDLPVADSARADPYAVAAETMANWKRDGVLITDAPAFYVYRMDYQDPTGHPRHTLGVLGALELSRPGEGGILPHEHTTPKAKSDRLNLLRATAANTSAVWGLSPAAGLSDLLGTDDPALASWTDPDGVRHSFWVLTDEDRLDKISATVAAAPVVIADGHHRYETSLAYRDERREASGAGAAGAAESGAAESGAFEFVMTYVVELAEDQLTVLPIHRLISGLPDGFDLAGALDPYFAVTPAGPVDAGMATMMRNQRCLVLVEANRVSLLTPRPEAMEGLRPLDTVRLDAALAGLPDHDLVFQHGIDNVVRAVERGEAQAGVLLRPATVGQITKIADGGERMPPKTTFFHPKPRTGVVFRALD